jgi:L-lactate utilization protein LutC
MATSDRSFSENLDLLIKLLRKLKNKSQFEGMPGVPKMFIMNFDFFLQNYEKMKDQISEQLLQQFGEPIKQMVAEMVEQLQEELDTNMIPEVETSSESPVITGHKRTLAEIDTLLKNPALSQEEIDKLLDERHKLRSKTENPDTI